MRAFLRLSRVREIFQCFSSVPKFRDAGIKWTQLKKTISHLKIYPVVLIASSPITYDPRSGMKTPVLGDPAVLESIVKARRLYKEQKYKESEDEFHTALRMAQENHDFEEVARIYYQLGDLAYDTGHYGKAKQILVEAAKLLFNLGYKEEDLMMLKGVLKLACIYGQVNAHEKAIMGFEMVVEKTMEGLQNPKNRTDPEMESFLGLVKHKYADYLVKINNLDHAQKLYHEAYQLRIRIVGEDDTAASLLNDVGSVCMLKGDYDEAEKYFEQSLKFVKDPVFVATFRLNLGINYIKKKTKKLAISHCEEAATIGRKLNHQGLQMQASFCLNEAKNL